MKYGFYELGLQSKIIKKQFLKQVSNLISDSSFILGPNLEKFEKEFAQFNNVNYCAGISSGLDAAVVAMQSLNLGENDEIIIPANTFIATALAISKIGAKIVLADCDDDYLISVNSIKSLITKKTKAVVFVSLYGRINKKLIEISNFCKKNDLILIEDAAQSHGANINNKYSGTFGDIGTFSFYPAKNLGAFGDGGCIVTNKKKLYETSLYLRNYGSRIKYNHKFKGGNYRLDSIQSIVLSLKLKYLNKWNSSRIKLANKYLSNISNKNIILPPYSEKKQNVWHLFVVRVENRKKFEKYLFSNGVQTVIHYPQCIHHHECYKKDFKSLSFKNADKFSKEIISLPLYPMMDEKVHDKIIRILNKY